jgi:hypothetical protein
VHVCSLAAKLVTQIGVRTFLTRLGQEDPDLTPAPRALGDASERLRRPRCIRDLDVTPQRSADGATAVYDGAGGRRGATLRHCLGINTAVSRLAGLIVVPVLSLIAGLTGSKFYDPAAMDHGFHVAMLACAALSTTGGVLAWLTISSEVLTTEPAPGGDLPTRVLRDFSCSISYRLTGRRERPVAITARTQATLRTTAQEARGARGWSGAGRR